MKLLGFFLDFLTIISPFAEPHVLILERLDNERFFLTVKPKLTKSFHGRVNAYKVEHNLQTRTLNINDRLTINHPENANCRANFRILPHIIIRAEQLECSIRRLQRLPVNIVELKIED